MDYNKDFDFYLLPSRDAFNEFLSQYNSKEEIPSYSKKDFAPIVDVAVLHNLFANRNCYEARKPIIEHIKDDKRKDELIEKVNIIYDSHMGGPLLYNLYLYSIVPGNRKSDIEREINAYLNLNNSPVDGLPEKIKRKKFNSK